MIRITLERHAQHNRPDLFCPHAFCDGCGERIEDARAGNYLRRIDLDRGDPVGDGALAFTHKHCTRAFEDAHGGRWFWESLTLLPLRLAANLSIDDTDASTRAAVMATVA